MRRDENDWREAQEEADDNKVERGYRWWQRIKIASVLLVLILIAASYFLRK
ncbi:hypothetical protein KRZ98_15655 [Sphingobium sp. AS12]|uniref:hypothetical protein n=1 Tax=Sphingobium sp. AS12 TaxID=2849495 RepID=UPI001C315862|nr:hypothetical protein [Sphingobium sp. AS12]MBV2149705.1 hypothetical protein [Sphingobium sp. AS12]